MNLRKNLTFGFEQTFTISDWWTEPGFTATSDTPKKREKMLDLAKELAIELKGKYFESNDIWDHMQYEVTDESGETQFYVTMDPGSIEVKTPPCLVDKTESMAAPLFIAAERANCVAYRNWWYGVQGGTEGGCHVNMGGYTFETNPLFNEPELVVKYAAYVHNRPWLHHPFMGLDVGPEGNAMRMDEKPEFLEVKNKFLEYRNLYKSGKKLAPQETYDFFKDTNLITEKGSYPSLYKFKEGLFLIEDRGQESMREARDFFLVSEMRVQILEHLQKEEFSEELLDFPDLHKDELTQLMLWKNFVQWTKDFKLPTEEYKRFFLRQFPILNGGTNVPSKFEIHDGRRPRVIKDIVKRGDVVVAKNIDPSFKRFEIHTTGLSTNIKLEAEGIEFESSVLSFEDIHFKYIDIKYNQDNPLLKISLKNEGKVIEQGIFNIQNMTWE